MTYAEYLRSMGACEEDLKVLDTAIARKAFEKQQADAEAVRAAAAKDLEAAQRERSQMNDWFNNTAVPEFKEMERRSIAAEAEAAKARAAWKAAQERGLIDAAQMTALGYDDKGAPAAPAAASLPPGFDPSKYVTTDTVRDISERAGDGLAVLQDIVLEHSQLFPDKPLRVRELRREAVAAGKTVDAFWQEKYGVHAAREKRESEIKAAYEKKLREEGAASERERLASQYGNPDTRPPLPSSSPFTLRPAGGRDKQPWQRQDDPVNDRVGRATSKLIERQNTTH